MWVYDKDTGELYHYDDELCHYGRKGMKWGQHIFDKVTATAGRAGRFIGKKIKTSARDARNTYRHKRDRRKFQKELDALRKKPLKDLTDDELKSRIDRFTKEKQAMDLQKSLSEGQKKVSAGKKFISKFVNDAITPSLVNAGKTVMTKWFETKGLDAVGLGKTVDSLSDLRKTAEQVRLEADILNNKKQIKLAEDFFNSRDNDLNNRKKKKKKT